MAKLNNTSSTAIAITFLVMNLSAWLRRVFLCVFMSSRLNNTWFEIEDKFQLYLKQINTEKLILNRARGYRSHLFFAGDRLFSKPSLFLSSYLAITNYQLPITNYQLPITNYQLPITNYQLPITNYQLPIT